MPTSRSGISNQLEKELTTAESMHNFVGANVPQRMVLDTDVKLLCGGLFSLALEHHGAILTLLRAGGLDGSAFALTRPLIDAVYRAHWLVFLRETKHRKANQTRRRLLSRSH